MTIGGLPAAWPQPSLLHPHAEPVGFSGLTGTNLIIAGRMLLMGWSLDNIGASAGTVIVHDGLDATGGIVACPMVSPNSSNDQWFGDTGILIGIGLFADFGADTWRGAFYVAPFRGERRP